MSEGLGVSSPFRREVVYHFKATTRIKKIVWLCHQFQYKDNQRDFVLSEVVVNIGKAVY
jgi:hypothetical protein